VKRENGVHSALRSIRTRPPAYRKSWPYVRTPLAVYLIVMGPICAMMCFLLLGRTPGWMRWSAGGVVAITLLSLYRGYGRRLVLSRIGARFCRVFGGICLPWSEVRRVGTYTPGGGLGATEYVYITTRDRRPEGKWDRGPDTIQLQARSGLVDAIEMARRSATADSPESGSVDG